MTQFAKERRPWMLRPPFLSLAPFPAAQSAVSLPSPAPRPSCVPPDGPEHAAKCNVGESASSSRDVPAASERPRLNSLLSHFVLSIKQITRVLDMHNYSGNVYRRGGTAIAAS